MPMHILSNDIYVHFMYSCVGKCVFIPAGARGGTTGGGRNKLRTSGIGSFWGFRQVALIADKLVRGGGGVGLAPVFNSNWR